MCSTTVAKIEKAINLEKSLLDDYRKRILYSNSNAQCIQHPQYSFYYSEYCRSYDRMYNKKCLENKDEKRFDELVRSIFLNAEASHLIFKLLNMVRESLYKNEVDFGKVIGALTIMEIYVKNLISMPWKKEFHVILTYSGMYKIWIDPHLVGIDHMFRQFGYRRRDDEDKFVLVEQFPTVHLEMTAMHFRLASVLCFIIYLTQKRIPDVPLSIVLETAQTAPISEHELVSNIKENLLMKDKLRRETIPQQIKADQNFDLKELLGVTSSHSNKRDTGTQYDINMDELSAKTNSNINLRLKTLNLDDFIMPSQHSTTQNKDEKYRGARSKDLEYAFEENQPTSYGFSQPFIKGFSMCLSPEFESIVDEEEDDESNQSPLSKLTRERMKADEELMKRMTFSTFKKQSSPSDVGLASYARDVIPNIHNHPQFYPLHSFRSKGGAEEDSFQFDAISIQSKSLQLENLIQARLEVGVDSQKK